MKVRLLKNTRSWKRFPQMEARAAEMNWAEQDRCAEVERVFSRRKEEFGPRSIRVRGASKILAHLVSGLLALAVDHGSS